MHSDTSVRLLALGTPKNVCTKRIACAPLQSHSFVSVMQKEHEKAHAPEVFAFCAYFPAFNTEQRMKRLLVRVRFHSWLPNGNQKEHCRPAFGYQTSGNQVITCYRGKLPVTGVTGKLPEVSHN